MQRKSKYNSVKTTVDGIAFDSKKEAKRYQELKLLEKAKLIRHLDRQPEFKFKLGCKNIFTYRADFQYLCESKGFVVEDVKGYKTREYKLKKKLIEAQFGIKILET